MNNERVDIGREADAGIAGRRDVVEVRVPYRRGGLVLPLFLGVGVSVGMPVCAMLGISPVFAPAVIVPLVMGAHLAVERSIVRIVQRIITRREEWFQTQREILTDDAFCEPLVLCARATANTILSFRQSPLRWVAVARARNGLAGQAVRIADKVDELPAIGPALQVPFEPTPLTERAELIGSVDGHTPTQGELLRERLATAMRASGRSRAARWFFIICLMIGGLGLIVMLLAAVRDVLEGRVPSSFRSVLMGAAAGAPIALLALFVAGWRQERWFVVPGAIVVRQASWWSQRSEVSIFRRGDSVVMHWLDANQLAVGAADGRMSSTAAPPRMAELAIRAWLSPLPPPELERLSDLGAPARID